MEQQQMMMMLPGIQPDELMTIQSLTKDMTDAQRQQFILFYQGKRKEQQNMLLMTIIGFFGIAGIQRFIIGETGMGVLYLLTVGFCGVGTIVDIVNIKKITSEHNTKQALESANMVRMLA